MKAFRFPIALLAVLFIATAATAALKVWTGHETLKYTDLNANFTQVNTSATELVTNAKVSSGAAIAHSKLATPALVPKAWVLVATSCTSLGSTCTITESSGVTSVVHDGSVVGRYTITFSSTLANTNYAIFTNALGAVRSCFVTGRSTTVVTIDCYDLATPTAADTAFNLMMMDL